MTVYFQGVFFFNIVAMKMAGWVSGTNFKT